MEGERENSVKVGEEERACPRRSRLLLCRVGKGKGILQTRGGGERKLFPI